MSQDHSKKLISEKLQTDPDFRDRVVDFILSRNFFDTSDDQKNVEEKGGPTPGQRNENYSSDAKRNKNKFSTGDRLDGYEHWVG